MSGIYSLKTRVAMMIDDDEGKYFFSRFQNLDSSTEPVKDRTLNFQGFGTQERAYIFFLRKKKRSFKGRFFRNFKLQLSVGGVNAELEFAAEVSMGSEMQAYACALKEANCPNSGFPDLRSEIDDIL